MSKRWVAWLAVCLICGAQQPTFRTGTTLVEFTVAATDAKGNPVTDLTKEDILITEKGHPREVAFFRFEGGEIPSRSQTLPTGEFTNRAEFSPGPARNITALVLDALNVGANGQAAVREDLMRYLNVLPRGTRVALYSLGKQVTVLHDFTEDIEALRRRIAAGEPQMPKQFGARGLIGGGGGFNVPGQSGSPEMAASKGEAAAAEARALGFYNRGVEDDRLAMTLAGLEAIGNRLAGIPGRKNLVWISSLIPIISRTDGWPKSHEVEFRRTAERLASQGISIYAVIGTPTGRATRGGIAMELMAQITGGRLVRVMNDPTRGVEVAAADSRGAYSVGFYSAADPDDQWHSVSVKSRRPGVRLLSRQGYVAERATPLAQEWTTDQWTAAIHGALGSNAMRIDARAVNQSGTIRMQLQIPAEDLSLHSIDGRLAADIEIAIAEKAPDGETRTIKLTAAIRAAEDQASRLKDGVFRHEWTWELKPGTATIRLIARDRHTGRHGSLDLPVSQIPTRPAGSR